MQPPILSDPPVFLGELPLMLVIGRLRTTPRTASLRPQHLDRIDTGRALSGEKRCKDRHSEQEGGGGRKEHGIPWVNSKEEWLQRSRREEGHNETDGGPQTSHHQALYEY